RRLHGGVVRLAAPQLVVPVVLVHVPDPFAVGGRCGPEKARSGGAEIHRRQPAPRDPLVAPRRERVQALDHDGARAAGNGEAQTVDAGLEPLGTGERGGVHRAARHAVERVNQLAESGLAGPAQRLLKPWDHPSHCCAASSPLESERLRKRSDSTGSERNLGSSKWRLSVAQSMAARRRNTRPAIEILRMAAASTPGHAPQTSAAYESRSTWLTMSAAAGGARSTAGLPHPAISQSRTRTEAGPLDLRIRMFLGWKSPCTKVDGVPSHARSICAQAASA